MISFEVVRVCSFFCCNGVCKSGLSSTKTKFEWDTSIRHKGIYAALFNLIASVSALQFTVQMSKLNRLGKTYRKRIFVVELKTSLALLLRTNCLREFTVTLFTQEHRCKLEKCQENFTNSISIPFRGSDRTLIHIMLKETGIRDPAVWTACLSQESTHPKYYFRFDSHLIQSLWDLRFQ